MSEKKTTYCWSRDGEEFHGYFETREEALDEATADAACDHGPDDVVILYTGEQRHAMHYLRKWEASIAEHLIEQLDEWLIDHIASDDIIVEVEKEKRAELGKLILDWVEKNASFNRWAVDGVQEHEVTLRAEGGEA